MNHPIRVAERVAMLDILSEGRIDFGAGRGASLQEVGAFGLDQSQTLPQLEESPHALPRLWTEDDASYEGELLKTSPRPIRPRPAQQPHPPMFLACTRPETITMADTYGLGALCLGFNGPDDIAEKRRRYDAAICARKPADLVGKFAIDHMGALCPTTVLDDREEARQEGLRGQRFFVESLEHWYGIDKPAPNPEAYADEDSLRALLESDEVKVTSFGHEQIQIATGKRNPNQAAYGRPVWTKSCFCFRWAPSRPPPSCRRSPDIGKKVIPHFRRPVGMVFATS
jgi:alkanesulfonate monooxygenase SsuD/methylene tetrahydromethanopterin reductase-like flavin-dependent oxidoreductase (luciferase family)